MFIKLKQGQHLFRREIISLEETLFDCKSRYFSGKMYYFFYKKNIWNLDFV
jgi:hypothetical protein